MTIGQVVGENLRRLREQRQLTQEQVALKAQGVGLAWSDDVVQQLEAEERDDLTVSEFSMLPSVIAVPIWEFFAGDGVIRWNRYTTITRAGMRKLLGSEEPGRPRLELDRPGRFTEHEFADAWWTDPKPIRMLGDAPTEAEQYVANQLGVTVDALRRALAGQQFDTVRDAKVGDLSTLTRDERRARRGHATRELIKELRQALSSAKTRRKR